MIKNKDVILISPPSKFIGPRPYYPRFCEAMGLSYLATMLERVGYKPTIIDTEVYGLSKVDILERVKKSENSNPLLIGIAALSKVTLEDALDIAAFLKRYGIKSHITFGGHLATFKHKELLEKYPFIDSVVRGEGEKTIIDLVNSLENNIPLKQIKGITFREGNQITVAPPNNLTHNLDELPFPKRYNLENMIYSRQRVPVCSSRGCYGSCSFCTLAFFTKKWRARSPKNVVDELEELYTKGVRRIRFDDENFFGHCKEGLERAIEFGEEILKRKFPESIRYKILCRADDLKEDILFTMKKAGLEKVSVGIESFNQRQLDFYNKNITLKKIEEIIDMIRRVKIDANFSFIMFDPYVTLDEISNNLEKMVKLPEFFEYRRLTSILKADVGTAITKKLEKEGLLEDNNDFSFRIRFQNPEIDLLWKIVEAYKTKYLPLDEKVTKTKDERMDLVVYKTKNNLENPREATVLKKINDAETKIYFGWIDILKYGIYLAKEYKRFEDIHNLFPERTNKKFDNASKLLDEAKQILYSK